MSDEPWPALPYEDWALTKKTLHMCTQMLGKLRLALAPPQPEWLHSCLYLDPHGFTTGPMPCGSRLCSAGIDMWGGALYLKKSDGGQANVSLESGRCVADVWNDFRDAAAALGLHVDLWEKPQEIPDTTRFPENRHDCTVELGQAQRFHRVLTSTNAVFEQFRSRFFGRTGIQFWWGSFDFAVLLFSGKHEQPPEDKGYIMRYDLDAQHLNVGFWPGDDNSPTPIFYGYLVPEPLGCDLALISPEYSGWVQAMEEWVLPYDKLRRSGDPGGDLRAFLDSIYGFALTGAGWDEAAHRYRPPAPPRRS